MAKPQTVAESLEHIAPQSFFESAAKNDVLQVVVFALIFSVGLSQVRGKPKETMLSFFEGLSEVMFKFTALVMYLAPHRRGRSDGCDFVGQFGMGVIKILI